MITAQRLRELLHYDPCTGVFTRLVSAPNCPAGKEAGRIQPGKGYRQLMVDGRRHQAHRLAWFYVHGVWPTREIDHINGIRDDNRIENLRLATKAENQQNVGKRRDNSSGFLGVVWFPKCSKWRAQINVGGKKHHIGLYDTPEEASAAYLTEKAKRHTFQPTPRET